jgi:hypothetical protein
MSTESLADAIIAHAGAELTRQELQGRLRAALRDAKSYERVEVSAALLARAVAELTPRSMIVPQPDIEPSDEELIDAVVEAFGGTAEQAIERLSRFASQYRQEEV